MLYRLPNVASVCFLWWFETWKELSKWGDQFKKGFSTIDAPGDSVAFPAVIWPFTLSLWEQWTSAWLCPCQTSQGLREQVPGVVSSQTSAPRASGEVGTAAWLRFPHRSHLQFRVLTFSMKKTDHPLLSGCMTLSTLMCNYLLCNISKFAGLRIFCGVILCLIYLYVPCIKLECINLSC